jgi:hypothetical protein
MPVQEDKAAAPVAFGASERKLLVPMVPCAAALTLPAAKRNEGDRRHGDRE